MTELQLAALRQERAEAARESRAIMDAHTDTVLDADTEKRLDAIEAKFQQFDNRIKREEAQLARERELGEGAPEKPKENALPFRTFGEQLRAIANASRRGAPVDERLMRVQAAAKGASEGVPSDGGFLVQQDFAAELIKNVHASSQLAPRCRRVGISAGANSLRMLGVDESSRANGSRWGGVQAYWVNEAASVTATKPKFREITLTLNKVMALYYATEELLADSSALEGVLRQAFAEELAYKLDAAIYEGNGSGQPLGVMNSGALITVAKETQQAADTVQYENLVKMWSRMTAASRANAVWFINQDVEPSLYGMAIRIGDGGVPVYMPASGVSGGMYNTLFNRPVVPVEQCNTLGDKGDLLLADMSQYLLADKGGVQMASSVHVEFLTDQTAFRVVYRVDGQPLINNALTPAKGSSSTSPFVTLAARA